MTITITTDRSTLDTNNPVTDENYYAYADELEAAVKCAYPSATVEFNEGIANSVAVGNAGSDSDDVCAHVWRLIRSTVERGEFWQ